MVPEGSPDSQISGCESMSEMMLIHRFRDACHKVLIYRPGSKCYNIACAPWCYMGATTTLVELPRLSCTERYSSILPRLQNLCTAAPSFQDCTEVRDRANFLNLEPCRSAFFFRTRKILLAKIGFGTSRERAHVA